jgi:alpha-D-xyloside xylohydrolase
MLQSRRFNIVLVKSGLQKALVLDNPKGKLVEYNGNAVTVKL